MALEALAGDPFDALGDQHRRQIVRLLRDGDQPVGRLADELPISRPAVSRHLRLLKEAGLVTDRADGTRRLYRLHDEGIEAVREYLDEMWGDVATRFKLYAENTAPGADPSPGSQDRDGAWKGGPGSGKSE
ncbi:MAG: ArsR/SmtB family transcription factor [Solirubrobacterales bacterium]